MKQQRRYSKKRTSTAGSSNYGKNVNLSVKKTPPLTKETQALDNSVKKTEKNMDNMKKNLDAGKVSFQSGEMYLQDMIALSFLANTLNNLKEAFQKDPTTAKKEMIDNLSEQVGNEKYKDSVEAYNKLKDYKAETTAIGAILNVTDDMNFKKVLDERKAEIENKIDLLIKEIPIGQDDVGNNIYAKNEKEFFEKMDKSESNDQKTYRNIDEKTREKIQNDIKSVDDLMSKIDEIKSSILESGIDEESTIRIAAVAEKTMDIVTSSQSPSLK